MLGELDSLHVAEDARAPLFPVPGISSCMEVPAMDLVGRGGGAWKSPPQDHAFFPRHGHGPGVGGAMLVGFGWGI